MSVPSHEAASQTSRKRKARLRGRSTRPRDLDRVGKRTGRIRGTGTVYSSVMGEGSRRNDCAYQGKVTKHVTLPYPTKPVDTELASILSVEHGCGDGLHRTCQDLVDSQRPIYRNEACETCVAH